MFDILVSNTNKIKCNQAIFKFLIFQNKNFYFYYMKTTKKS